MLDKNIPYYNVIMKRRGTLKSAVLELPDGFYMIAYRDGDEYFWADIETSVDEFENCEAALSYFNKDYMKHKSELYKRVFFLVNDKSEKIGTISAWWSYKDGIEIPSIHWVAIKPGYQGKGLGRAMINFGIRKSIEVDGEKDNYLHTQTWSYKAINLYLKEGYELVKDETFASFKNENEDARRVFKEFNISFFS